MQILVTGSDNLRRITHSAHLASEGFDVVEAQTYRDAQTILRAGMLPQLIVINVKPADASAGAFVEWVRGEHHDVQIVAVGGDGAALGADVALPLSIDTHSLIRALHLAAYSST